MLYFNGVGTWLDLLSGDRQDGQVDAIEFVETTPRTGLGQALEDATQSAVVHLLRTVEHHHVLAQRLPRSAGEKDNVKRNKTNHRLDSSTELSRWARETLKTGHFVSFNESLQL